VINLSLIFLWEYLSIAHLHRLKPIKSKITTLSLKTLFSNSIFLPQTLTALSFYIQSIKEMYASAIVSLSPNIQHTNLQRLILLVSKENIANKQGMKLLIAGFPHRKLALLLFG